MIHMVGSGFYLTGIFYFTDIHTMFCYPTQYNTIQYNTIQYNTIQK